MDVTHFDSLARKLTTASSRRTLLGLTFGGTLAGLLTRLGRDEAAARKRRKKKLERNEYGCVDVGKACRGMDANCCSGICQGKKPKKGKKDTSRCVAHNVLGCQAEQDQCAGAPAQCGSTPMGICYRTTGNASYCGVLGGCFECETDADCVAGSFLDGAACVICSECVLTGGTACFAAAP